MLSKFILWQEPWSFQFKNSWSDFSQLWVWQLFKDIINGAPLQWQDRFASSCTKNIDVLFRKGTTTRKLMKIENFCPIERSTHLQSSLGIETYFKWLWHLFCMAKSKLNLKTSSAPQLESKLLGKTEILWRPVCINYGWLEQTERIKDHSLAIIPYNRRILTLNKMLLAQYHHGDVSVILDSDKVTFFHSRSVNSEFPSFRVSDKGKYLHTHSAWCVCFTNAGGTREEAHLLPYGRPGWWTPRCPRVASCWLLCILHVGHLDRTWRRGRIRPGRPNDHRNRALTHLNSQSQIPGRQFDLTCDLSPCLI